MHTLEQQLNELDAFIPSFEKNNVKVSKANVAWHIDHSLRVINSIAKALAQSDPKEYKAKFNFWRILFLTLNFLPRGKGRAPKKVLADAEITTDDLKRRLGFARGNGTNLKQFSEKSFFPHPYFGDLNLSQAQKFICIHTEHHLKIIRDIERE